MSIFYLKTYEPSGESHELAFDGLREAKEYLFLWPNAKDSEAVIYSHTRDGIKVKWRKVINMLYWKKIK